MNEAAGQFNSAAKLASREKYWEECDAEQKIARLRDELARACRIIESQGRHISTLLSHEHNGKGEMVIPLHGRNHALSESSGGAFTHDGGIPFSLRMERERSR